MSDRGFVVLVFVEGDFDCLVHCTTLGEARAWAGGARYGAGKYAGDNFCAVDVDPRSTIEEINGRIYGADSTITQSEIVKAVGALANEGRADR